MQRAIPLSSKIAEYCNTVALDSPSTAVQYGSMLRNFETFLHDNYGGLTPEQLIADTINKTQDVYQILAAYHLHLKTLNLSKNTIGHRVMNAKTFLEFFNVPISNVQFRRKVRAKKHNNIPLEALSKNMVRNIILGCQDPRLQAYVTILAGTGMRAVEPLSIRYRDIDWEQGAVTIRSEFTKTKQDRRVYLTKECIAKLKYWKDYRERKRRIIDNKSGRVRYMTKPFEPNHLFFTAGRWRVCKNPGNLYNQLALEFGNVLDRLGYSEREENKGRRHKISLHSFRRFVKTTISDLGYQDYSEWFIGHAGSTYYRKPEAEKREIFKKIEPYLTYLSYDELERKGADTESELAEARKEIQILKQKVAQVREQTLDEATEYLERRMREVIPGLIDKELKTSRWEEVSRKAKSMDELLKLVNAKRLSAEGTTT